MNITATSRKHGLTEFLSIPSYHYFRLEFEPTWEPVFINDDVIISWCDQCDNPITENQAYQHMGKNVFLCKGCMTNKPESA